MMIIITFFKQKSIHNVKSFFFFFLISFSFSYLNQFKNFILFTFLLLLGINVIEPEIQKTAESINNMKIESNTNDSSQN